LPAYFSRSEEKYELKTSTWAIAKRVSPLAKPFRFKILWVLLCIAGQTALKLIPPLISAKLIDQVLPNKDLSGLNLLGAALLAAPITSTVLRIGESYLSTLIASEFTFNLRTLLFAHLQLMSIRFYTNTKTGELMSRLNNDVPGAQRAITGTFISVLTNIFTLFFGLVIMFRLEWRLALLAIGIFPIFILPARQLGFKVRELTRENLDTYAKMNAIITEVLTIHGVLLMKLFGRQTESRSKYNEAVRAVADSSIKSSVIDTLFFTMIGIVSVVGTALVYWVGGRLYLGM
jgi:ATP-binding cassette subfamily B protein